MHQRLSRRTALGLAGLGFVATNSIAPSVTRAMIPARQPEATPAPDTQSPDSYAFLGNLPRFSVSSDDVLDGAEFSAPQRSGILGAGGEDISPHLTWTGLPSGTSSLIVTMFDPDAPTPSGFWHWVVADIPATTAELATGAGSAGAQILPAGARIALNDARVPQYVGAAPPPGQTHRYILAVLALDVPTVDVAPDATPALLHFSALSHILGYGLLVPVATTP